MSWDLATVPGRHRGVLDPLLRAHLCQVKRGPELNAPSGSCLRHLLVGSLDLAKTTPLQVSGENQPGETRPCVLGRCSGGVSSLWSWMKSGRHGSRHHMSRWNSGSAPCGMGALGESIQARGPSWMHSGWSREAWKGAEWSSQSSWGWFTLKSPLPQQHTVPHPSATFPRQAAGTGPSALHTCCTLRKDKPLLRMAKPRLGMLTMFVQCHPADEPQCRVQTRVSGFKDSACHHQSFTVASAWGHGVRRGRGGGWVRVGVKQGGPNSRTVALGEVQSELWKVQRSRKILPGH